MTLVGKYLDVADQDLHQALLLAVSDLQKLRGILLRVHGVLGDADDIPVPSDVYADISIAVRLLLEQRDEAREGLSFWRSRTWTVG